MRTLLNHNTLRHLYTNLHKTDKEIADFFNVDRTSIVHLRKRFGINSRKSIGEIGEELAMKEFRSRGYDVVNMNEEDKLHIFDLLVNNQIKVEIKTSSLHNDSFKFIFTDKEENKNIESFHRIKLKNGRTKKLFHKTCDVLMLVGVEENGDSHFFIMKPTDIPIHLQGVSVTLNPFAKSKYNRYRENWDLFEQIKKSDAPTSDHKENITYY